MYEYGSEIEISSRIYWVKLVDMLQQNWALIETNAEDSATIYFINDASEVFDSIIYPSVQAAQEGLLDNGFVPYAERPNLQALITPPAPPFRKDDHSDEPIYSSGRFWKNVPGYKYLSEEDPFFVMCGAVIGDIAGSLYEGSFRKERPKEIILGISRFTDDTVLTCAVAEGLLRGLSLVDRLALPDSAPLQELVTREIAVAVKKYARRYPHAGYGKSFNNWVQKDTLDPYNSYGNGSAMRVSFAGWYADSLEEAQLFGKLTAQITHNHPDAIKGASVVASCIYILRSGGSKKDVAEFARKFYNLDFTLDSLRPIHGFNITCEGTVPVAIAAFLESEYFVDMIKLAISMGGDTDTLAAIAGAIGEAYYSIPQYLQVEAVKKLDDFLLESFKASTLELASQGRWQRRSVPVAEPLKCQCIW